MACGPVWADPGSIRPAAVRLRHGRVWQRWRWLPLRRRGVRHRAAGRYRYHSVQIPLPIVRPCTGPRKDLVTRAAERPRKRGKHETIPRAFLRSRCGHLAWGQGKEDRLSRPAGAGGHGRCARRPRAHRICCGAGQKLASAGAWKRPAPWHVPACPVPRRAQLPSRPVRAPSQWRISSPRAASGREPPRVPPATPLPGSSPWACPGRPPGCSWAGQRTGQQANGTTCVANRRERVRNPKSTATRNSRSDRVLTNAPGRTRTSRLSGRPEPLVQPASCARNREKTSGVPRLSCF